MKYSVLIFSLFFTISEVMGQAVGVLDYNNVEARINGNGTLFEDIANQAPAFEVPRGSGSHAMYTANLWFSGIDMNTDSLFASAHAKYGDGLFSTGPLADQYDEAYTKRYDRVWIVDKEMIEDFRNNWQNSNYDVPWAIEDWPGNGNTSNGEAAKLAPFVDRNKDNIYDPKDGDYPCILGDQAVFAIFNDENNRDVIDNGYGLGIEIHIMAYEYKDSSAVNNTVFLNYTIHNRRSKNFKEFRIGFFGDPDLGCALDDYIGCNPSLNSFFVYNGDILDEDCRGAIGYKLYPPAVGITLLSDEMESFIVPEYGTGFPTGFPQTPLESHSMLSGKWSDGSNMTWGGIGYGGIMKVKYMYPSDPNDTSGWADDLLHYPGERRGLANLKPKTLAPGEKIKADFAIVWSRRMNGKEEYPSVTALFEDIQVVRDYYKVITDDCEKYVGVDEVADHNGFSIYPNPARDFLMIDLKGGTVDRIQVFNALGKELVNTTKNIQKLDVSTMDPGIYFLNIRVKNRLVSKKFIVE